MPAARLKEILKGANELRGQGAQVNLAIMKKNKKFQKEQLTQEGYEEIVEFYRETLQKKEED